MGIDATIIRRLRKERDLTQESLAKIVHVSRQTVVSWENGAFSPEGGNLVRLAQALGTTVSFLLGETGDAHTTSLSSLSSAAQSTGETTPITLPSGRVVDATPQQLAAYRAWETHRTVESTNTVAATLGVPITALVPIANPDRYPTQAHRDLAALLQVMSQIDPRAGLTTRGNLKIWQFTENDVRHILDVIIDTTQWKINQATGAPKKKDEDRRP